MSDRPVASDLSFEVMQLRARRFELGTPKLDSTNQKLHPIPCALVQREAFIADRVAGVSEAEWDVIRQQRKLNG